MGTAAGRGGGGREPPEGAGGPGRGEGGGAGRGPGWSAGTGWWRQVGRAGGRGEPRGVTAGSGGAGRGGGGERPGLGRPASRAPGAGTAVEVVSAVIISLAGVSGKLGRRKGEECNFSQLGKPKVVSGYCCPPPRGEARAGACRKYQLVSFHKGQMVAGSLGLY